VLRRLTQGLPRPYRVVIDWLVTILGAVIVVLAVKAWIVNPYRIPSSSMEPTLHCARPDDGCEARFSDRILACRICYAIGSPQRGDIVVFRAPAKAVNKCGEGGTFVKRLIGLPGDTVYEDVYGYIWINHRRLKEPYISRKARFADAGDYSHVARTWHVPKGHYFFLGDNRANSCDSRLWGTVARGAIIGKVVATYWPPSRLSVA
jgi:signal peptidase I